MSKETVPPDAKELLAETAEQVLKTAEGFALEIDPIFAKVVAGLCIQHAADRLSGTPIDVITSYLDDWLGDICESMSEAGESEPTVKWPILYSGPAPSTARTFGHTFLFPPAAQDVAMMTKKVVQRASDWCIQQGEAMVTVPTFTLYETSSYDQYGVTTKLVMKCRTSPQTVWIDEYGSPEPAVLLHTTPSNSKGMELVWVLKNAWKDEQPHPSLVDGPY